MRARIILAALALSTFAYVTAETLPIGLLPQISSGLGTSPSAVGLLVTAYGLIVVIFTIPLTRLTHRWSRRRLLGVLLLVFSLATALSALAPNYPALLAARVVTALSQAVFWAIVTPATASLFRPEVRGRALSILYAGTAVAPLAGVPAGTWLGQQAGWRAPFAVLAGLGLAILIAVHAFLPDQPPGRHDTDRGTAPDPARYRVLLLTTTLVVTGTFIAFTYINPFLTEVSGFAPAAVGPLLLIRGLAGLLGVIVAGFLVERHAWSTLVAVVGGQAVALGAQFALGSAQVATIVAMSASSFAMAGLTAALGARLLEVAPGDTDLASAGTSTAFNVGITAGALIGSALIAGVGVRSVALVGAAVAAVAFAVVVSEPVLVRGRQCAGVLDRPAMDRA